VKINCKNYYME